MSRNEITFRAWNERTGKMLDGDLIEATPMISTGLSYGKLFVAETYHGDWRELEIMQFTGLRDKNGKEIFEDDIVETSYSRDHEQRHAFLVEWHEDGGQWLFTPFEVGNQDAPLLGIEEFSHSWEDISLVNAEVLGNIYENPELLTK